MLLLLKKKLRILLHHLYVNVMIIYQKFIHTKLILISNLKIYDESVQIQMGFKRDLMIPGIFTIFFYKVLIMNTSLRWIYISQFHNWKLCTISIYYRGKKIPWKTYFLVLLKKDSLWIEKKTYFNIEMCKVKKKKMDVYIVLKDKKKCSKKKKYREKTLHTTPFACIFLVNLKIFLGSCFEQKIKIHDRIIWVPIYTK